MNRELQTICEELGKASADLLAVAVAFEECAAGTRATPAQLEQWVAGMRDHWETTLRARFKRKLIPAMLDATSEAFKARMIAKTSPHAQEMRGLDPLKIVM